jgi:MATE family multidrug resistance protein
MTNAAQVEGGVQPSGSDEEPRSSICRQLVRFGASSAPMILVQVLQNLVSLLTVTRLGRHDPSWLAGASLGCLIFNVFGLMLVIAPMTALDTVAPQSYGAGRYDQVGLETQRAVATAFLFLAPATVTWAYAPQLLDALGQPPEAARLAGTFLHVLLFALPLMAVFEASRRFLYAQNVRWSPVVAAAVSTALHPVWQEVLVGAYGFVGGPLAMLCTYTLCATGLLAYLAFVRPYEPRTWPGLRPRALLADWRATKRFLGLSVAGALGLSEWLFWEAVCFRAGRFGRVPLAVHGTAYSIVPLAFMVPLGLSIGMSNGVGQHLGAGNVAGAKRLAILALGCGLALVATGSAAVFVWQTQIVLSYSLDGEVLTGAAQIWPWLCIDLFFDGSFALVSGLGRGLGLQRRCAACIVTCLWPIGIPLIFSSTSVLQIWQRMPLIYLAMDSMLVFCCACADWERLAETIRQEAPLASSSDCETKSSSSTWLPAMEGNAASAERTVELSRT